MYVILLYAYDLIIEYLRKHPLVGALTASISGLLAYKDEINTVLGWVGAGVGISVGLLTGWAKYLEVKERSINLRQKREKDRDSQ